MCIELDIFFDFVLENGTFPPWLACSCLQVLAHRLGLIPLMVDAELFAYKVRRCCCSGLAIVAGCIDVDVDADVDVDVDHASSTAPTAADTAAPPTMHANVQRPSCIAREEAPSEVHHIACSAGPAHATMLCTA